VVDVEEGALGALEEHALAAAQRAVEDTTGVVDVGLELASPFDGLDMQLGGVDALGAVEILQLEVLELGDRIELLAQAITNE